MSPASFAASLLLQCAAVASLGDRWKVATVLCAAGVAIVAWCVNFDNRRRRRNTIVAITLIAAALLMAPRVWLVPREGGFAARAAVLQRSNSASFGGNHDGVILLPKEEPKVTLLPSLPVIRPNLFATTDPQPLSLPFHGVYWLFKRPYVRPPFGSLTEHGTPAEFGFSSTDFRPLLMEAHQDFGQWIDIRGCSEIRMEITNADRFPNSVFVELVLIDPVEGRSLTLGSEQVASTPLWGAGEENRSYSEILKFRIPANPPLTGFHEVAVRFHLDPLRSTKSARIAIRRFLLIPRA